jgi:hypothetical protein
MSTKAVYVIDLMNVGDVHRDFNFERVDALKSDNKNLTCIVHKDVTYLNEITGVDVKHIISVNPTSRLYRWLIVNLYILIILITSYRRRYIFLHLPPLSQFFICVLNKVLKRHITFYLHGELSYLLDGDGIGKTVGKFILRKVLTENWSGVYKICIDEFVYKNLANQLMINKHYVYFEKRRRNPKSKVNEIIYNENSIKILTVGVISKNKKYNLINLLSENPTVINRFDLKICGKSDGSLNPTEFHKNISIDMRHSFIEHEEYIAQFNDCAAVFIPQLFSEHYMLVSSGLLDFCFDNNIPMITKRHEMLADIEAKYGEIGILIDNEKSLSTYDFEVLKPTYLDKCHSNLKKYNESR